ncbi:MAG: acyl-CoA thioesterase [Ignavibacteriales bacterium]|nr:acyl-CoA thioesterase [Ignavibacteriales bacterium]
MFFSLTKIRVRYADTDQMKMVYYGKYFEYFEQGRSDLMREIGMPYSEIEKRGIFIPVIEAHAEYGKPCRFDELLEVKTILKEIPSSKIIIEYELRNAETSELYATGYTHHCFLNSSNQIPTRAPVYFREAVEKAFLTTSIK